MSSVQEISQDLKFVRDAVDRRERDRQRDPGWMIYWVWAIYVLVGYFLIDVRPAVAGWFFLFGGVVGGLVSRWIARRTRAAVGEVDRATARTDMLHWLGGMAVAYATIILLAVMIPALRGEAGSQVFVAIFGLVYFFWGVHRQRAFIWLGLVLIAGGACVTLIPYYRWTCLGVIIAAGLVAASIIHKPKARSDEIHRRDAEVAEDRP